MKLFDATRIPVLTRALDAYALRHKTIATNIANLTTPGYRARSVRFEEELAGAMQGGMIKGAATDPHHLPIGGQDLNTATARITETPAEGLSADPAASGMNNVDLDQEMAMLAKNQINFKFSARLIADTFRGLQKSIRGTL